MAPKIALTRGSSVSEALAEDFTNKFNETFETRKRRYYQRNPRRDTHLIGLIRRC